MKRYSIFTVYDTGDTGFDLNLSVKEILNLCYNFNEIGICFWSLPENPSEVELLKAYYAYTSVGMYSSTSFESDSGIISYTVFSVQEAGTIQEDFPNEKEIAKFMRNLFDEWKNEK